MPHAKSNADGFVKSFNDFAPSFGLTTPERICHFLAQVAHESGELRYTEELASGAAYEGRKDLGNTVKGYGVRYKGRGYLQLTGYINYKAYSEFVGYDFYSTASRAKGVAGPANALRSAMWFWTYGRRDLSLIADLDNDRNTEVVLQRITKYINGGLNGLAARRRYLKRAKEVVRG
ncbi:MAG: hypothetical protein MSD82_12380 [Prevotella sp.]|nr:hypothetical protein [Prevotella sp.]